MQAKGMSRQMRCPRSKATAVIYRVVDARNYVAPGADRPPAAARALAEYS